MLLLHGGAGSFSVEAFAGLLASAEPARVITPVHPGFDGTPRPGGLGSVAALARVYGQLLRDLGLRDVCVVGNSIGGWIAAELALAQSAAADRRVSSVVLVDAAGLRVDAAPAADFFSLTLDEVFDISYFNPDKFRIDPAALPAERAAAMAANRSRSRCTAARRRPTPACSAACRASPSRRSSSGAPPTAWCRRAHGRGVRRAIPGAQFRLIETAGHLPQLETPDELLAVVWQFAAGHTES